MRYAIVENGVVENIVEWDGEKPFNPGVDKSLVEIGAVVVSRGHIYDGNVFTAPTPPTPVTELKLHVSSKLVDKELEITTGDDWQDLGGVVANAGFFVKDLARILGRVTGSVKVDGAGTELRLLESDGLGGDVVLGSVALDDTAGEWETAKFVTNVAPRAGDMTYLFQGRLHGAVAAFIRFYSVSLLEVIYIKQ